MKTKTRQHVTHVTLCGRLLIGIAEAAVPAVPDAAVAPAATAASAVGVASASAAACAPDVAAAAHAAAEAAAFCEPTDCHPLDEHPWQVGGMLIHTSLHDKTPQRKLQATSRTRVRAR